MEQRTMQQDELLYHEEEHRVARAEALKLVSTPPQSNSWNALTQNNELAW